MKSPKQFKAEYILNRVSMLNTLKKCRHVVEKIALDGIETEEEEIIAKIACSIIASEYYYDDAVMNDKTSKDGEYPLFPTG